MNEKSLVSRSLFRRLMWCNLMQLLANVTIIELFLSFLPRSSFLDFALFYFFFCFNECVSQREPIMMIVQVFQSFFMLHVFFSEKVGFFLSLSHSLFFTNFFFDHTQFTKKTPTHVHVMYQYSDSNLEWISSFFHLYFLVHEEFYILRLLCAFFWRFFLSILSVIIFSAFKINLKFIDFLYF